MDAIPCYARGAYRVFELRDVEHGHAFVVVNPAGAPLYEDASFDGARDWVDRRDAMTHSAPVQRARGRR